MNTLTLKLLFIDIHRFRLHYYTSTHNQLTPAVLLIRTRMLLEVPEEEVSLPVLDKVIRTKYFNKLKNNLKYKNLKLCNPIIFWRQVEWSANYLEWPDALFLKKN